MGREIGRKESSEQDGKRNRQKRKPLTGWEEKQAEKKAVNRMGREIVTKESSEQDGKRNSQKRKP